MSSEMTPADRSHWSTGVPSSLTQASVPETAVKNRLPTASPSMKLRSSARRKSEARTGSLVE